MNTLRVAVLLLAILSGVRFAASDDSLGHSRHGAAFDTGLRQKPWRMEGIGKAPFPITTKCSEVQQWFDQGNALLQSFWYEEAERSFRWCLKLDPDCAMAYWGLARTGLNWSTGLADYPDVKRYKDFLKEAVRRKNSVTPRERLYIEAWDTAMSVDVSDRVKTLNQKLQQLALAYPDDVEAETLVAFFSIKAGNALGTEMILRDILQKAPDHPGAHHARIHNWDGVLAEQALASCQAYGRVAPAIGHANHMPGHNYSKIGMWHEAARSMDAAARVELRYMNERLALPFESWNYPHNRNYLCYIQEQLGMAGASLQGASDLLAAPRDPQRDKEREFRLADQGIMAQIRALIKFERWDDILRPGTISWRDDDDDKLLRAFVETLAYAGQGKTVDARSRLAELKELVKALAENDERGDTNKNVKDRFAIELKTSEGLLCAAEGNLLDATRFLTDAAAIERQARDTDQYQDDPPNAAWPVNRLLGDVFLKAREHRLAIEAYDRALAAGTQRRVLPGRFGPGTFPTRQPRESDPVRWPIRIRLGQLRSGIAVEVGGRRAGAQRGSHRADTRAAAPLHPRCPIRHRPAELAALRRTAARLPRHRRQGGQPRRLPRPKRPACFLSQRRVSALREATRRPSTTEPRIGRPRTPSSWR